MPGSAYAGKSWIDGPRNTATAGDAFSADPDITAQDSTNAAKLTAEGYVPVPTSNWTAGQKITIGPHAFHWNGTTWVAGAHP